MARRDSGKKAAKDGKTLRAAGKMAAAGARTTKKKPPQSRADSSDRDSAGAGDRDGRPTKRRASRNVDDQNLENHWPLKRDVLFKPERLQYVRKQLQVEGCVFCEAAKRAEKTEAGSEARRESLVLYADDRVMVIMNKYPYNTGHLLVLPRRHEGLMQDLTTDEVQVVFLMVQRCVEVLQEVYKPAGFNVGLNLGASAGAGIPEHLHTHVIPRWNGDTNFFPLIAQTKVVVETLEQTFDRLINYFDK
jgi:ATP adenylyltransferase